MGVDSKLFSLVDVREVGAGNKSCLLSSGDEDVSDHLSYPMGIDCFESAMPEKGSAIRIVFESPVSLIKQRKTSGIAGYQEKSNGFPSFYQLVRSAAYRVEKLTTLYHSPDDIAGYSASHEEIEHYVEEAASGVWLEDVCLHREIHQSTRKEGTDRRMLFAGYTGKITFAGNYLKYLPLLRCIEQLGVGEKLSYGFGKIRMEEHPAQISNQLLKKKEKVCQKKYSY